MYKFCITFVFLLISSNSYALKPIKEYLGTPSNLNIDYEEVEVDNTSLNYKLCSWISHPKGEAKGVLIFSYGDYGNMSYFLDYIKFYTDLGFIVISYDYRGFGKSSNFFTHEDYLFHLEFVDDLKTVLSFTKKKFPKSKIGLVSLSMGTIIVAIAMQDEVVDFMINESAVYDLDEIVLRLKKLKGKTIIIPVNNINLLEMWNNINNRMLFISGKEDVVTTAKDTYAIVEQDKSKRLILIHKGNHMGVLRSVDENMIVTDTVVNFLDESM